jgi:hypothetical protein
MIDKEFIENIDLCNRDSTDIPFLNVNEDKSKINFSFKIAEEELSKNMARI